MTCHRDRVGMNLVLRDGNRLSSAWTSQHGQCVNLPGAVALKEILAFPGLPNDIQSRLAFTRDQARNILKFRGIRLRAFHTHNSFLSLNKYTHLHQATFEQRDMVRILSTVTTAHPESMSSVHLNDQPGPLVDRMSCPLRTGRSPKGDIIPIEGVPRSLVSFHLLKSVLSPENLSDADRTSTLATRSQDWWLQIQGTDRLRASAPGL